jgi:hypothetical protein
LQAVAVNKKGESQMSADRFEEEHHLTPAGWRKGSQKLYDNETKTVVRPIGAVLTMVKESISPCGIEPAEVSWREIWRSRKAGVKQIDSLLKKHGDPMRTPNKMRFA